NGIVHVTAKDKGTGKENTITIQDGSGLSQDEIDRMIKDAEAHADEDKKRREEQEVRNNAESLVYQPRKFVEEHSEKVSEDLEAIKAAVEKLNTESQEMGKAIYEADAAAGATQADAGAEGAADDNVVDAEVVEDDAADNGEDKK